MATNFFLLNTNFQPRPSLQQQPFFDPYGSSAPKPIHILRIKSTNFSSKLAIKCSRNDKPETIGATEMTNGEKSFKDGAFSRSTLLKNTTAAGAVLGMFYLFDCSSAFAASVGRMGGRSFSSRSSSRSSRSSRSSSSPGSLFGPSSWGRSSSSSTRHWSSSPKTSSQDSDSVSSEINYTTSTSVPPPSPENLTEDDFPSPFSMCMLILAVLVRVAFQALEIYNDSELLSILKLQVGLLGMARSLQKDLNKIAETSDTSTSEGLKHLLTETVRALQQHRDYCISGFSSVVVKNSVEEGEGVFNSFSVYECANLDEETLDNNAASSKAYNKVHNEYIVITILVAAEGDNKLPPINGVGDLQKALQNLASIPSRKIKAVEVLWTPQAENDMLSKKDLLAKYPVLRSL